MAHSVLNELEETWANAIRENKETPKEYEDDEDNSSGTSLETIGMKLKGHKDW